MVKLYNVQRRMRVFNLEHPTFLNQNAEHSVGKPETLTLLAHEKRDVEDDVLLCVEVRKALNPLVGRPTLRVVG